jgi:hypothetical protein
MQIQQRRTFFLVFAIFFIVCVPFLVLFSLGYSFNLKNPEIKNSLSVKIQTIPNGADISTGEEIKGQTPIDLSINENQNVNLKVRLKEYFSEEFVVSSDSKNGIVDLSNLWLLPAKSEKISNPQNEVIQIISENLAIIKSKNNFWIQSFGLSGFDNNTQAIQESNTLSAKTITLPELSPNSQEFLLDTKKYWQKISDTYYYRDNTLLIKKDGFWQIKNLSESNNITIKKVAKIDNANLSILDNEKKLWILNLENLDLRFVDQGIDSMQSAGTPNKIWLWKYNTLYRFNPSDILTNNLDWNRNIFLKNGLIGDEVGGKFDVQNIFQGTAVQVGKYVLYTPDYKENQWQLLATNTKQIATENETLFLIDETNNLSSYNLYNNTQRFILTLNETPVSFGYVKEWNRLVFYSMDGVSSTWYNKEIFNPNIKVYRNNSWIQNQQCYSKVIAKVQFCVEDKTLVVYKNNGFF